MLNFHSIAFQVFQLYDSIQPFLQLVESAEIFQVQWVVKYFQYKFKPLLLVSIYHLVVIK